MSDAPNRDGPETEAIVASVQRWRRQVVRLWVTTMVAAIAVWGVFAAVALPWIVELGAGILLALLAGASLLQMRRGVCPECGARIRFEPRIELPRACPHCGVPFVPLP